jgi:hypothetical protein
MHRIDGNPVLDSRSLMIPAGRRGTLDVGTNEVDLVFVQGAEIKADFTIVSDRATITFTNFDGPLGSAVQFDSVMNHNGATVSLAVAVRSIGSAPNLHRIVEFVAYSPA